MSEYFDITFLDKVVALENGLSLPDSLGNSVTLMSSLAKKYQVQDRNAYLKIENMVAWDPYAASEWMDEVEREQLAQIVCEHLLRIKNYSRAITTVVELLPAKFRSVADWPDCDAKKAYLVLAWYIQKINETNQIKESGAQAYIRNQDKYIEEQHAYIERQHQMIYELQAKVKNAVHPLRSILKRILRFR